MTHTEFMNRHLKNPLEGSGAEYYVDCPFCGKPSKEKKSSYNTDKGLFNCLSGSCQKKANTFQIAEHLNVELNNYTTNSVLEKTYFTYTDEKGNDIHRTGRVDKIVNGKKSKDTWYEKFENGKWVNGLSKKRYLYNLTALPGADVIYIPEGEKCAEILNKLGFVATTNVGGTGMGWKDYYNKYFQGKEVFIIADKDSQGLKHAYRIQRSLDFGYVVELPGLKNKEDVEQYLGEYGHTKSEFLEQCTLAKRKQTQLQTKLKEIVIDPFLLNPDGKAKPDPYALTKAILAQNHNLRRNIVKGKPQFKGKDENDWMEFTNKDLNDFTILISSVLASHGIRSIAKDTVFNVIGSSFLEDFHPFINYFNKLPKWDQKVDPIKELADTVKVSDKDYAKWHDYFKRWLVGVIAQGTNVSRNFKMSLNQQVLVLQGGQGIGKSTFFNSLFDPYYIMDGNIDPGNKDDMIELTGTLIANLDELESTTKKEYSELKSLITKGSVTFRRPYGKFDETVRKYASFCGSVNNASFLSDETGERRWLVISAEDIDLPKVKATDMDKVWSQAKYLLDTGFKYYFDKEDQKAITNHNEQFKKISAEEELILKYFKKTDKNTGAFYTSTDIQSFLSGKEHNTKTIPLGKALVKLNHTKAKNRGRYGYWLVERTDFEISTDKLPETEEGNSTF